MKTSHIIFGAIAAVGFSIIATVAGSFVWIINHHGDSTQIEQTQAETPPEKLTDLEKYQQATDPRTMALKRCVDIAGIPQPPTPHQITPSEMRILLNCTNRVVEEFRKP
jgi:hypothetical protein